MRTSCEVNCLKTLCFSYMRFSSENSFNSQRITPIKMSFNSYEPNKSEINKPPLIIMHGLFGSKSNWNSLSKAISNQTGRQVITVDARNHGDSIHSNEFSYHHLAADVHHLTEVMCLPKVCVLGHSMGGRAMMLYAHIHPDNVEKLIVVDISQKSPSGEMAGLGKYFAAMKGVHLENNLSLSDGRKQANEQLSASIEENDIRQFLLTNLIKQQGEFKWRLNLSVLENAFFTAITDFPEIKSQFNKPTLFIGGNKSSYLRKEHHDEISQLFPKAVFEYLDSGHWVHVEKPNEFLKLKILW